MLQCRQNNVQETIKTTSAFSSEHGGNGLARSGWLHSVPHGARRVWHRAGLRIPPAPLIRGTRKASQGIGLPPFKGVPEGRGIQRTSQAEGRGIQKKLPSPQGNPNLESIHQLTISIN